MNKEEFNLSIILLGWRKLDIPKNTIYTNDVENSWIMHLKHGINARDVVSLKLGNREWQKANNTAWTDYETYDECFVEVLKHG